MFKNVVTCVMGKFLLNQNSEKRLYSNKEDAVY